MDIPYYKSSIVERDQFAQTPEYLYNDLNHLFGPFDFDPCPVDPQFDGLSVEWGQNNYVNPPFKELKKWLLKSVEEWKKGKQIIFLMPVRIHTKYFIENIYPLIETEQISMHIIKGGVQFKGYEKKMPGGMMFLRFPFKV